MARFALLLAVGLLAAAAVEATRNHVWQDTGVRPPSTHVHRVYVSVKQQNLDQLEDLVWAVSDPKSSEYGQYKSLEEIRDIVAPTTEAFDAVWNWLSDAGAFNMDTVVTRDVIVAHMVTEDLEAAMGVRMTVFTHPKLGSKIVRTLDNILLPMHVADHVDLIQSVNDFPTPARRRARDIYPGTTTDKAPVAPALGAAVVGAMIQAEPEVTVTFSVTCADGSQSTTTPPCADHPPALTSVTVDAFAMFNSDDEHSNTMEPSCTVPAGAKSAVCTAVVEAEFYHLYNVSVTPRFGKTAGVTGYWVLPVAGTPGVTPQTINALYGIPQNMYVTNGTQSVGEFEQQYYDPTDLDAFFSAMGIAGREGVVKVVGPNIPSDDGGEANLDIQYIMGMAPGVPTTFWSIKANSTIEIDDILKWGYQVGNTTNPPMINSLSYGMTEAHVDEYLGAGYLNRSDVEFMKLAVRGVTIIIADGDTGAGDLGAPPMSEPTCKTLHPDWPSQSPYVTAVSSTYITPHAQPICYIPESEGGINCDHQPLSEVTVNMDYGLFWGSGGGFSDVTKRPAYQEAFVSKYLSQTANLPPAAMFNAAGRAYPDVVAVGHNLMISWNKKFMPIDGTSASAPIFAGVMSLLNGQRLNEDMPALGFLNPLLYHIGATRPSAFRDIVVGNNRCGSQGFYPLCCAAGFPATVGWDASSGLGSPYYPVLLEEVMKYGRKAKQHQHQRK